MRKIVEASIVGCLMLGGMVAHATDRTWTGATDGLWDTTSNWLPAGVPGGGADVAVFNASSTANLAISVTAGDWLSGIRVLDPAADIVLNTANVNVGNVDMSAAARDLTINSSVGPVVSQVGASQNYNIGSGRTLAFAGQDLNLANNNPLSISGAGTVSMTKFLNMNGGVGGNTTLNASGGTLQMQGIRMWKGNNTVNQTGGTVEMTGNALALAHGVTGDYNNTYNLAGGTLKSPGVSINAASGGTTAFIFDGGTYQSTLANSTFTTALDELRIDGGGATIDTAGFTLPLAKDISGTGDLTKIGVGGLWLQTANTYGDTTIDGGAVIGNASGALGSGNIMVDSGTLQLKYADAVDALDAIDLIVSSAGSTLSLDFSTGQLSVNRLSLDGGSTWLASGVYDASAGSNISGTGTVLVAIPEPATLSLIGIAASFLFISRRLRI